jgi:hypothetical protein
MISCNASKMEARRQGLTRLRVNAREPPLRPALYSDNAAGNRSTSPKRCRVSKTELPYPKLTGKSAFRELLSRGNPG